MSGFLYRLGMHFSAFVYALATIWSGLAVYGAVSLFLEDGGFAYALNVALSAMYFAACLAITVYCHWSAKQ